MLKFLPAGAAHSVWWFRDDAGTFTSWYVNLEEPGVRWDDGVAAGPERDREQAVLVRDHEGLEGRVQVGRQLRREGDVVLRFGLHRPMKHHAVPVGCTDCG